MLPCAAVHSLDVKGWTSRYPDQVHEANYGDARAMHK